MLDEGARSGGSATPEERARRAEDRLRFLVDNVPDAVVSLDRNGVITSWNREAARVFGWDAEQAIGDRFAELLISEQHRDAYATLAASGATRIDALRLGLTIVPVELRLVAAPESSDEVAWVAFFRDVTDSVRAEHESRAVHAIAKASPDAILGVAPDGTILSWNPAAEALFGCEASEAIGTPVGRVFPRSERDTRNWLLDSIARGIAIESTLLDLIGANHQELRAFVATHPIVRADGAIAAAADIFRDASDNLAARSRVDAAEHLASLGRLARAVGHEFNNILMGVQPFTDVLARQELTATGKKAIDHIRTSIDRGRRVTSEISRFARASAPPELRTVPVQWWLQSFEREVRAALADGIRLRTSVETPDTTMLADPEKLKEVVLSLTSNACDAMPHGGTLSIVVRHAESAPHAGDQPENWLELLVCDTGTGIEPQLLEQVFEPLFTTRRGRVGLGLATVEQIVRRHGGKVTILSELEKGTTVCMLIPRGGTVISQKKSTPRMAAVRDVQKVLLVEDDVAVAAGLSAALDAAGLEVDVVHTGASVLPAVRAFQPDVVVLDVRLPDADGIEVYYTMVDSFPGLPVIFSSGHADVADAASALRNAHVGFLRKPYATDELLREIERVSGART
jgi:PAS domain S-box-containing protein